MKKRLEALETWVLDNLSMIVLFVIIMVVAGYFAGLGGFLFAALSWVLSVVKIHEKETEKKKILREAEKDLTDLEDSADQAKEAVDEADAKADAQADKDATPTGDPEKDKQKVLDLLDDLDQLDPALETDTKDK